MCQGNMNISAFVTPVENYQGWLKAHPQPGVSLM
jgi:hypothetical protein